MKDVDLFIKKPFDWASIPKKAKLGFILINLAFIGPFYLSLSMLFGMDPLKISEDPWIMFFVYAAPIQLLFTAIIGEISVNFFVIKKSTVSWYLTIFTAAWIGIQDSIAVIIFWLKYPHGTLPLAPFVTTAILVGCWLVKDYVFSEA